MNNKYIRKIFPIRPLSYNKGPFSDKIKQKTDVWPIVPRITIRKKTVKYENHEDFESLADTVILFGIGWILYITYMWFRVKLSN